MNKSIRNLLCASAAMAPFAFSAPVMAADQPSTAGVDTVVVTAQKRAENIQDVPIAITAVSAKALAASNVKSLQDLTTVVSGYAGPGDTSMESPHLRGVGSQVGSPGLEASVATYVDGIYIGATSPALLKLNDVSDVEVLKGPQGTLFGRNTTGGVVQVQTRNPGPTPEADLEATYANYETVSGAAYFNLPINPNIATNLAIEGSGAGQGWGKNLYTGNPTYKLDSELAVRNKWDFRLNDSTKFQFIADYEHHSDLGFFDEGGLPGTTTDSGYTYTATGWNTTDNADARNFSDAFGITGRLSHDFGFATLTNTLAYRSTIFDLLNFEANGAPGPGYLGNPTNYGDFNIFWHTADHQWTDELQLASKGNDRLQWTAGFFYYNATDINNQPINNAFATNGAGLPFPSETTKSTIHTASYAAYAQASYKIFPNTTLTGGLRWSYDQHSMSGLVEIPSGNPPNCVGAPTLPPPIAQCETLPAFAHQALSYRVALQQRLSDDAMVYVSFNHGDKSGGFNPVVINNPAFSDEQLDAYEVGTKNTFFDKRVRLNLSGFYYNYTNIQIQVFRGGPPQIYNGPSATLYGLDGDIEVRPTSALTINGNFEVLHSAYGNFPLAQFYLPCTSFSPPACFGAGNGYFNSFQNAKGNPLPIAPDFTASVAVDYRIPTNYGQWELNGTYSYNSGYYTSPGLEVHQAAYSLLGASVQFSAPDERYYVRVWGQNLTNTQDHSVFDITTNGILGALNAPRTFGVTLGAKFK